MGSIYKPFFLEQKIHVPFRKQVGKEEPTAVNTNLKIGPIDRPYGEQRGTRGGRQPTELVQLQLFFFNYGGTSCFLCRGQTNPAEKAARDVHHF